MQDKTKEEDPLFWSAANLGVLSGMGLASMPKHPLKEIKPLVINQMQKKL